MLLFLDLFLPLSRRIAIALVGTEIDISLIRVYWTQDFPGAPEKKAKIANIKTHSQENFNITGV